MYLEIFFIIWKWINTSFRKRSNVNFHGYAIPGQARDDVKYLWPYNFTTVRLRVGARNDDLYPRPLRDTKETAELCEACDPVCRVLRVEFVNES